MGNTTKFAELRKIPPVSETHWREIAAQAHRLRSEAGDEALAKTHETAISEIRNCFAAGSSRTLRYCPRCLERGHKYILIYMGGVDCCGTCAWPKDTPPPKR
jgi:hypothetical protein